MPFRFWRRIRLAPGVTLNLSISTASLSLGPRGAKYTVSPRSNRATAGLTGTGLFYTVHDSKRAGRDSATKDFILTHIFRISPYLLNRAEDFRRELLHLHDRGPDPALFGRSPMQSHDCGINPQQSFASCRCPRSPGRQKFALLPTFARTVVLNASAA